MRLRTKMFIGSAILAVIPVVITAIFTSRTAASEGQQALTEVAQGHIISVRNTKKAQIEEYFRLISNQIQVYASSRPIISAMKGFKTTFPRFVDEAGLGEVEEEGPPIPQVLPIDEYREALSEYYTVDYTEEFNALNVESVPEEDMLARLDQLEDNSIALQYNYIANNSNPLGTKEELFAADDSSTYTQVHRENHRAINVYRKRFDFEDIFLVDIDTGYVVYSTLKEIDFATSLREGPYTGSGLGQIFEKAQALGHRQTVVVDFAPYLPAYNGAAGFIATPIFDDNTKIGILIFQLPIVSVNDIMTYNKSWSLEESGRTGESYIVASDGKMRNDSRLLIEDKEEYMDAIEKVGMSEEIISEISLKDTSVGLQEVDNPGTRSAFAGVTGYDMFPDYRDEFVLAAFAPIDVPGLSWAVFSTIQEDESLERLERLTSEITRSSFPIAAAILILGGATGIFIFGRIAAPIGHLETTMTKVAEGDFTARAEINTSDELGTLANAFNGLLDDRLSALAKAEKENEMLNNSIIELLKASFQLSQRDLTVQVPVTEDVTGPLADAINQMATETSKVLLDVRHISEEVESASHHVKEQGDNVSKVAEAEREVVDATMTELSAAAEAMNKIAEVAQSCNEIATQATRSTQTALATVTSTVEGMGEIRETIHETEKRIKRLGERSQEISSIVDIINNIAERTHVLALNASMQAAAAGEAGRGFSVVADEVQRLAESSRNATSQISALVKNIQVETNDTIATMDKTIGQVVEGSRLAERAGEQMKETQNTTANLVQVVEQIAMASRQQAQISNELRERAQIIQSSTQETAKQLEEQTIQTDRLVDFSKQLLESVHVFKLPGV